MAAITRVKARPCTPVGYEVVDKVELAEAVTAGDLLKFNGTVNDGLSQMVKVDGGDLDADAIALQDGYSGQRGFSVGIHGEMDGFSGMTPGTKLYPSATVDGGLDTTLPTGGIARVKAVRASRIRYNFI